MKKKKRIKELERRVEELEREVYGYSTTEYGYPSDNPTLSIKTPDPREWLRKLG